jgi:hypothetical protein
MAAIVMTIKAIRQIERCGTSSLLERAFKGFSAHDERPRRRIAATNRQIDPRWESWKQKMPGRPALK